jgi:glutaredoxin
MIDAHMSPVTCPKCRYVRQAGDTAPAWQCPSCGVAYAKATPSAAPAQMNTGWTPSRNRPEGRPWLKLLAIAAVLYGAWLGWSKVGGSKLGGRATSQDIAALAQSVKPGDVTIYTTSTCGYCKQAMAWMAQNAFAYTECNTDTHAACAQTFKSFGSTGVPYLVVKGHHMKEGFDTDEFLSALKP